METISLCMIVKNEEKSIERCLNSVSDFVDEIIIVDTGSTDRTKEVALKFTDKIFDFKWIDDFSAARNFSISKATKDWILILDADESISKIDLDKLREILSVEEKVDAYYLIWRTYTNEIGRIGLKSTKDDLYEESKIASGFTEDSVLRLFRNNKEFPLQKGNSLSLQMETENTKSIQSNKKFYFEGKVHETALNSIKSAKGSILLSNIVIHHFGDLKSKQEIAEKKDKYISLLKDKIEDSQTNEKPEYFVLFELARELMIIDNFEQAKTYLKKSIELNPDFSTTLFMLGSIYIIEKKLDEAEKLLKKAVALDGLNPNIHANLGVIYSERGELVKAIRKFERALELNPKSADNYYNLGIIYNKQNKKKEAIRYFEKAIELNPNYQDKVKLS
ncbi:MAG: tetratricopeptide repeat protein [Nanoarchaeota archaeon]|nr:tetratricopeptide repeat protein [Nanoarchaeota archaeon]